MCILYEQGGDSSEAMFLWGRHWIPIEYVQKPALIMKKIEFSREALRVVPLPASLSHKRKALAVL